MSIIYVLIGGTFFSFLILFYRYLRVRRKPLLLSIPVSTPKVKVDEHYLAACEEIDQLHLAGEPITPFQMDGHWWRSGPSTSHPNGRTGYVTKID